MRGGDPTRLAKFRRLLPRLVLDRPVFVPRQPIVVGIAEPFDDLCDVTLRLVHVSGRTYAERNVQLGPQSGPVGLGLALNLPPGAYEVVATPPLAEFFGRTPAEHRLPLTVATAEIVTAPAVDVEARRAAVRSALDDDAGSGAAADRLRLLAILAARADDGHDLSRRVLAALARGGGRGALAEALQHLGAEGFDMAPAGLAATAAALAALAALGEDGASDLAAALLDKLGLCLALSSAAGLPAAFPPSATARLDPLAPLSWYLWGVGVASATDPAVRALALADGYLPPPFLGAIAAPAGADRNRQIHDGGPAATTWRSGPLLVASRGDAWQARLDPDRCLFATGAAGVWQVGATVVARYDGPAGIVVPFWGFDDVERTATGILGRVGDHAVALATDGCFLAPRAHAGARVDLAGPAVVACLVGAAAAGAALAEWAAAAVAGFAAAVPPPDGLHIDSAYCRARRGDQHLIVACGEDSLQLDLMPLQDAD